MKTAPHPSEKSVPRLETPPQPLIFSPALSPSLSPNPSFWHARWRRKTPLVSRNVLHGAGSSVTLKYNSLVHIPKQHAVRVYFPFCSL